MAIFRAYFDASGNKRSRVLTVAGFVSRVEKWERFEDHWRDALRLYELDDFHMTDFVSFAGRYAQFRGDENKQKRIQFLESLIECIKRSTNKGFAVSLQVEDYKAINSEYELQENIGQPYVLCSTVVLERLKDWAERKGVDYRKILCVFEDGDEGRGDLIEKARSDNFNVVLQSKKLIRAFDACDLAAWKAKSAIDDTYNRKRYHGQGAKGVDALTKSLEKLAAIVQDNGMYDSGSLRSICVLGVARR